MISTEYPIRVSDYIPRPSPPQFLFVTTTVTAGLVASLLGRNELDGSGRKEQVKQAQKYTRTKIHSWKRTNSIVLIVETKYRPNVLVEKNEKNGGAKILTIMEASTIVVEITSSVSGWWWWLEKMVQWRN